MVFVFHRLQRVLAGPGAKKSPGVKKDSSRPPRPRIFGESVTNDEVPTTSSYHEVPTTSCQPRFPTSSGRNFIDDEAQVCDRYMLFFILF